MNEIEKEKIECIKQRLRLSNELEHYIFIEYEPKIKEYTNQIQELDKTIKVLFND